ncbi:MAG: hypothetical protein LH606_12985 [Cytophagaceae bacterium]|nr:hypothetical protein [Cytophagaceae bacterium]
MQKILRFLTIGAFFTTFPLLADVPAPVAPTLKWRTEGAEPLANRFISQPVVRPGKATLGLWQNSGTRTVVILDPNAGSKATPATKRSASRLPKK